MSYSVLMPKSMETLAGLSITRVNQTSFRCECLLIIE